MNSIIETAKQAALSAAEIINDGAINLCELEIQQKSHFDFVSNIDRNAEQVIKQHVFEVFPDHQVLGESFF